MAALSSWKLPKNLTGDGPADPAAPSTPDTKPSDAELVRRAAQGDADAIAAIWSRHVSMVRGVLVSTIGFDSELDDLIQEVFLNLFKAVKDVRDGQALPAILARIAVRRAGMALRKRRVRAIIRLLPTAQLPEPEVPPVNPDDRRALVALYRVLDRLPTRSRLAFVLHHIEDMGQKDIADALGVSLATTKRALSDGRTRFLALAREEPALALFLPSTNGTAP